MPYHTDLLQSFEVFGKIPSWSSSKLHSCGANKITFHPRNAQYMRKRQKANSVNTSFQQQTQRTFLD
jgi:hypothetical protein